MTAGTRERLLDAAETLIRTRGYAAFSYADLSERVGIRKASIHHHFPTKAELGAALVDGYLVKFEDALRTILDTQKSARDRLRSYAGFFADSMNEGMLPLCGALSAEMSVLPEPLQGRVRHFFELHLAWLESVVRAGVAANELRGDLEAKPAATLILSALEGASLVAWATGDAGVIDRTGRQVIADLERAVSRSRKRVAGTIDSASAG
jgi:TetR/AcrR family transcriptional regulator, transcriptional repressor for nem operon